MESHGRLIVVVIAHSDVVMCQIVVTFSALRRHGQHVVFAASSYRRHGVAIPSMILQR